MLDRVNYQPRAKLPSRSLWGATVTLLLSMLALCTHANDQAILEGERFHPVQARQGMVATSHTLATDLALQVLKKGGNAIDASVTAGFALAVTQPRSGNVGGGGFLLYSPGDGTAPEAIDYRETAPAAASETMFQDKDGNVVNQLSRFSHQAAGVPGTVAGLALALERHGTISLSDALAPAIRLARDGFVVPHRFTEGLEQARDRLQRWPATKATFIKRMVRHHSPATCSHNRNWRPPYNALQISVSKAFTRVKPPV